MGHGIFHSFTTSSSSSYWWSTGSAAVEIASHHRFQVVFVSNAFFKSSLRYFLKNGVFNSQKEKKFIPSIYYLSCCRFHTNLYGAPVYFRADNKNRRIFFLNSFHHTGTTLLHRTNPPHLPNLELAQFYHLCARVIRNVFFSVFALRPDSSFGNREGLISSPDYESRFSFFPLFLPMVANSSRRPLLHTFDHYLI